MRELRRPAEARTAAGPPAAPHELSVRDGRRAFLRLQWLPPGAVYEAVEQMVGSVGQSTAAADASIDKVRYTRKITDEEKNAMAAKIKGFREYNNNSEDPKDIETGRMLLRKLEDDAEFNAQMWARQMKKEPTDDNKFGYYNAVADFELISEPT